MDTFSRHLLRLVISCRKLSAEVSAPQTQAIVAMATSAEPEFALRQRALLARNPSTKLLWTPATAARVGEILTQRLLAIGVDEGKQLPILPPPPSTIAKSSQGRLIGGALSRLSLSLFSALGCELRVLRSSDGLNAEILVTG